MRTNRAILEVPVSRVNQNTGKVETGILTVRPARKDMQELKAVAELYAARMKPGLEQFGVTPGQLKDRCDRDPKSILLGFINGELVSKISIVKISGPIPSTYQELTGNDTWETSDPTTGNIWVCPWVTTHPDKGAGWKGELNGRTKSLGQLQVSAVAIAAKEAASTVKAVVAYSRPGDLYEYLVERWGEGRISINLPGRMVLDGYKMIKIDKEKNEFYYTYGGSSRVIFSLMQYLNLRAAGRIYDTVIRMHVENGAVLDWKMIFPYGQVWDGRSIFYRICLVYGLI